MQTENLCGAKIMVIRVGHTGEQGKRIISVNRNGNIKKRTKILGNGRKKQWILADRRRIGFMIYGCAAFRAGAIMPDADWHRPSGEPEVLILHLLKSEKGYCPPDRRRA